MSQLQRPGHWLRSCNKFWLNSVTCYIHTPEFQAGSSVWRLLHTEHTSSLARSVFPDGEDNVSNDNWLKAHQMTDSSDITDSHPHNASTTVQSTWLECCIKLVSLAFEHFMWCQNTLSNCCALYFYSITCNKTTSVVNLIVITSKKDIVKLLPARNISRKKTKCQKSRLSTFSATVYCLKLHTNWIFLKVLEKI